MKNPLILDIKGNSMDDGEGIRTVVFFKGCPLSCKWCHNPESKKTQAEIAFDASDCIGCGICRTLCAKNALDLSNPFYIDRAKCDLCFDCVKECPSKALSRVGKEMTVREIFSQILPDKIFFDVSGGGVTLSGGEATLFPEFSGGLLALCRENGIRTLLETCGFFDFDGVEREILPFLNDIYYDIKLFDRELHKKYCGAYNDIILENFKKLIGAADKYGFTLLPRTPLIPEITDTDENLTAIACFLAASGVKRAALLPYNPTWEPKNAKIGRKAEVELKNCKSWQTADKISRCKEIFLKRNIEV